MPQPLTLDALKLPSYTYVLWVHDRLLKEFGGLAGVTKEAQILSALQRPKQVLAYAEHDVDLYDLTAALCYGLAKNHGFVDGNKRTALSVSLSFFAFNYIQNYPEHNIRIDKLIFEYDDDDIVKVMEDLANDKIGEGTLADIMRTYLKFK